MNDLCEGSTCVWGLVCCNQYLDSSLGAEERAFTAVDENGGRGRFGSRFTLYAGIHQPDEISEKLCGTKCVSTEMDL